LSSTAVRHAEAKIMPQGITDTPPAAALPFLKRSQYAGAIFCTVHKQVRQLPAILKTNKDQGQTFDASRACCPGDHHHKKNQTDIS